MKRSVVKAVGAAIDMLETAIRLCPDGLWYSETKFWHNAFNCLFYLDYYLKNCLTGWKGKMPFVDCFFK